MLRSLKQWFLRWIDETAETMVSLFSRLRKPAQIKLTQIGRDRWTLQRGSAGETVPLTLTNGTFQGAAPATFANSEVRAVLSPDRFLFKQIELPARAADFLDGVVRAQIDRLTPWSADQAAFGAAAPVKLSDDRISVTVAATAKSSIAPVMDALKNLGTRSIELCTVQPHDTSAPISVERQAFSEVRLRRVRKALIATLAGSAAVAVFILLVATYAGNALQARQDEAARQIARQHAALRAALERANDPARDAERALAKGKNDVLPAVLVLEVLSKLLPDNTYVTELRIEGDKLRVSGITADAPSLIRLMEQSQHFSRAVFFAPTTRSPSDPGYRFHIETQILPNFSLS